MPTFDAARADAAARVVAAQQRRSAASRDVQAVLTAARAAGRSNLTSAETQIAQAARSERAAARGELAEAEARLAEWDAMAAGEAGYLERSRDTHPVPPPAAGAAAGGTAYPLGGQQPRAIEGGGPRWVRTNDMRPAVVERGASIGDHPVVTQMAAANAAREQAVIGMHGGFGQMVRSMTTTTGSALVPTAWSAAIIDRARNLAAVTQAGAELVPMDAKIIQIGRLTADPTAAFRAEGSPITASDPVFDNVTLTAKTLTALVVGSLEWFQDANNVDQVVSEAVAKAIALAIDYAALFGGLTTGNEGVNLPSPPNPVGILAGLLANAPSSVLGGATNGTALTPATPWNELLSAWFTPQTYNEVPNAILYNAKMAQKYAMTYDSLGQPLRQPDALTAAQKYVTNQVPSFTAGTMSNIATDVFAGDFHQLIIGQRLDLTIQTLTERYAEAGQVGIVATWRGDVQLARPRAFAVYRYLGGS